MKSIEQETTSLGELGLTLDHIMAGERAEFDPEQGRLNPRKVSYIRHDFADKLVSAYATDLLAAYRVIEELETKLEDTGVELEGATEAAKKAAEQVRTVMKSDSEFAKAETMLSQFEHQLELLAKDKQTGRETIAQLQAQVNELVTLRDTVPQLEADVNAVLENLRSYFVEEGIDIDDYNDDDYDDYGEDV